MTVLDSGWQQVLVNSLLADSQSVVVAAQDAASRHALPSAVFRPTLTIDGNQWCALYGDNLQDGVAGFGDSPADAMWNFDRAWAKKLGESS